ncbi:MAG: sensor histidine kinase [Ignavibacteriaceae bacterium]|nr:sensor histidine kinase [Ignavibacteriaceae bacterium]
MNNSLPSSHTDNCNKTPGLEENLQSVKMLLEKEKKRSELLEIELKEKENLLREVRHRVKNNLQVVSSLLNIQSDYVKDKEAHKLFINSLNRIKAMAMVHENIYQTSNSSGIDIDKYLKDLVIYLFRSYNINAGLIKLNIDIGSFSLSLDTAITCGLLINEIISNSFKHAFPDGRSGNVQLSIQDSADQYIMVVSDDGIGLPDNIKLENHSPFGLLLISTLVDQINGNIVLEKQNGTKFTINFPNKII